MAFSLDPESERYDVRVGLVQTRFLHWYMDRVLTTIVDRIMPDTRLFWSICGRSGVGKVTVPMNDKNIWRLCKTYGRMIGYPELKPHDLRHGVAMEVYGVHHDLEPVRALLGHERLETTQIYASIRPRQLKETVAFYEEKAAQMLGADG